MPFGFLRRQPPPAREAVAPPAPAGPAPGSSRGVRFTAITEEWRLSGRMSIPGRLSDALNRREAIPIDDVRWGPSDGSAAPVPAPGLRSVDPYDLILVTAGGDSLPPLSEVERDALRIHKVSFDVALEVPPFRVTGTVFLAPGAEPARLLDRSPEMFIPVVSAAATLGDVRVSEPDVDVVLVNRAYLRAVAPLDPDTIGAGAPDRA